MEVPEPTRQQAVAALVEADRRASQVRHADLQLRWMLLAVLGAYIVVAVLMSVSGRKGSPVAVIGIIGALAVALVVAFVVGLRIRAYSRAGIRMYFASIIVFNLWNAAVTSASIGTGFWGSGRPAYDFGISVAIGVVPLAVGAMLVARRS